MAVAGSTNVTVEKFVKNSLLETSRVEVTRDIWVQVKDKY
jgi:hypothetical protein